ncbi:MAG: hypothetical protein HY748_05540 [Elusimicrobia bacterium]|nr:hypothetical protein [Elusimicrobiota bacterium]
MRGVVRHKPGKAGLEFFRTLARRALPGWSVESLRFSDRGVEFSLARASERLSYELVRRGSGGGELRPCDAASGRQVRAPSHGQALSSVLGAVPFDKLLRRLKADGLLYSDPQGPQPPSRLDRFHRTADHTADWWKFFFPRKPFLEEAVVLGKGVAVVSHASRECRFNSVQASVASLRLFADDRYPPSRRDILYHDTDLGEREVAQGRTLEALASKMREAASRGRPAFIHLMTTCLPEIVGDDPRPIIKRLEKGSRVRVVWTSKTRDSGSSFNDVIDWILRRIRFSSLRDPKAVILAGAPLAARGELGRLLGSLGLRVAGSMFPDLDIRAMPGVGSAGAVVWGDPVGWEKIGDEHFIRNGLSVVRYHPPFGIEGTKAWLARVAAVLGLDPRPIGHAAASHAGLESLLALRKAASKRTVALVGDRADLEAMVLRGRPMGFSVGSVLAEMGFRVRCLVCDAGSAEGWRRGPAASLSAGVEFVPFKTAGELDGLLAGGVDLAFTHLNFDPRLARHGIAGFCENAFELGVEGFIRTARRLLRRCETRPFPRHRRHLAP